MDQENSAGAEEKIQVFKRQEMGNTKQLSDTLIRDNTALNLRIEFIENQLEHLKN